MCARWGDRQLWKTGGSNTKGDAFLIGLAATIIAGKIVCSRAKKPQKTGLF